MKIKTDKKGLIIHQKLTKEQAKPFILFLGLERVRHQDDIDNIDKTLKYLGKKHGIYFEDIEEELS